MKPIKMPKGVEEGPGQMRISVVLDRKVFEDVCAYGINQGWSFSAAINDLAKCGIFDIKEAELWTTRAAV